MSKPEKVFDQALFDAHPGGKVAEITLRVRWWPGAEDPPSQWNLTELLAMDGPEDVRVIGARDVPGLDPEEDPAEES